MSETSESNDDSSAEPEAIEPESDKPVEPEETELIQEDPQPDAPVAPEETQPLPFEDRLTEDVRTFGDE